MIPSILLATALLFTADAQADSAKKRIRQNAIQRRGNHYQLRTTAESDDDTAAAEIASFDLDVCSHSVGCLDTLTVEQKDFKVSLRSSPFTYDDADLPPGTDEAMLQSQLYDSDGNALGEAQLWRVSSGKAGEGELDVKPDAGVDGGTYLSELKLTADDCGTGRVLASVSGDDAASVASVEIIDVDGTLFDAADASDCDGFSCIDAGVASTTARYRANKADFGSAGDKLAELEEETVTLTWTLYNSDGKELDTVKTEATAKYGDILIDGVPLEFD